MTQHHLTAAFAAWENTAARTPGSHGRITHEIRICDLDTGHTLNLLITPGQAADLAQRLNTTERTAR
jgi:hypothetical protein